MIVDRETVQGTEEWHMLRIGSPGMSSLDKIITSTGKKSTQRQSYLYQMAGEKLLGAKEESYSNATMARGIELEPKARQLFTLMTGNKVEEVGMVYRDELKLFHASPDGLLIGEDAGVEIKCPLLSTHIEYLAKGTLPTKYRCQVQGSMAVCGFDHWHFMSFYPGIKPLILKVERDEKFCSLILEALEEFCFDVNQLVKKLAV